MCATHSSWCCLTHTLTSAQHACLRMSTRIDIFVRAAPCRAANAGAGLWDIYLHLLPDEKDMSCLLNYTAEEAVELQAKRMIVSHTLACMHA